MVLSVGARATSSTNERLEVYDKNEVYQKWGTYFFIIISFILFLFFFLGGWSLSGKCAIHGCLKGTPPPPPSWGDDTKMKGETMEAVAIRRGPTLTHVTLNPKP